MRRLLVVGLVVLAACGPHARLAVNMRSVSITVPRLLTPAVELVPPPSQPLPVPIALPVLPPLELPPVATPLPAPPPQAAPVACPVASELAVPDVTAAITVANPPVPGLYVQRRDGHYAGASVSPATGSLKGTTATLITALPSTVSSTGQKVDAWSVTRADTGGTVMSIEVYQLVHPSTSPLATAAGIYLTGLRWLDPVRGAVTFAPSGNGVEILPLPVTSSSALPYQFASSQTDPNTLTTLTLAGNVTGKKRIDVCGTVVDTYTVALTGALTSPGMSRNITWRQQIATQFDGAEIEDELALSDSSGFTWDRTLRDTTVPKAAP